jgi:hypothetical protein
MIPKVVHYVWVGPKPLPPRDRAFVEGWRRLLPDYEFRFWSNETIDFRNRYLREAFAVRAWNRVSDVQRMLALHEHGGIYLDTDVELRRRLDPLLGQPCFLGYQRDDHVECVNGAVLGAVPGHWFIRELIDAFEGSMQGFQNVGSYSGPGLISDRLRRHGLPAPSREPQTLKDITLYPTRYPYHWEERFSEERVTPDTYAIHHWADTWKPATTKARAGRRLLRHLARLNTDLALHLTRSAVRREQRRLSAA